MTLWFELKYALRLIARKSGHSALCVLVVAMSLGLSLIVFSLIYNTSYKQLDFTNSERWVYATHLELDSGIVNFADSIDAFAYQEISNRVSSFEEFGAMVGFAQSRFNAEERTTIFNTVQLSPGLLNAINISPVIGRSLTDADEIPGSENVVMLSYNVWRNYYASDENIVGTQTRLDETPFTIIGVLPEVVPFPINFDLMVPFRLRNMAEPSSMYRDLTPMGILAEGVSMEVANDEIASIMAELRADYSDHYRSTEGITLRPLNTLFMERGAVLFVAMAVTALVILFLACLNIANLLLSRGMERDQEFAIRNAVGSSRAVLVRQSLLESLIICLLGTLAGLAVAFIGLNSVNEMFQIVGDQIPTGLPVNWDFKLDLAVVVSSVLFTAGIWLFSGFMPAWMSSKPNVDEILKGGTKGTADRKKFRFSKALVGFEIFSSCFLLVLCGVLVLSIQDLLETDFGFATESRMVSDIEFPRIGYRGAESYLGFFDELQRQVGMEPEINQMAVASSLPFNTGQTSYAIESSLPDESDDYPLQYLVSVSDSFFETVEVEILEGRNFDSTDNEESAPVLIVDEQFARNAWPGESPLGKSIQLNPEQNGEFHTVIGVSSHTKQVIEIFGLTTTTAFFVPFSQQPDPNSSLIVNTELPEIQYLQIMENAVSRVDSSVALYNSRSFDDHMNSTTAGLDLIARVFLWIALLTLVLAGTGIFAIISRSVIQRIRESGIRRALGSTDTQVIHMYLQQGLVYLAIGVFFGGGLALLASSAMSAVISQLMSYVPLVLTTVVLGMAALVGLASWLPSRRAVAMEPGEALHHD